MSLSLAVQLAKIDRYESRLMSMAYMGNFDELLNSAQPVSMKLSIWSLWVVHNLLIWPYPPFWSNSLTSYKESARIFNAHIFCVNHRTLIFTCSKLMQSSQLHSQCLEAAGWKKFLRWSLIFHWCPMITTHIASHTYICAFRSFWPLVTTWTAAGGEQFMGSNWSLSARWERNSWRV